MIETLTINQFEPLLHTAFVIGFTPEAKASARLTRVSAWGGVADGKRQPFTLEFETVLTTHYYPQGIYPLVHPTLGTLDLFMVPLGLGPSGMRYEIVIS